MKKIPTLFVRDYSTKPFTITSKVTPGLEYIADGGGVATLKVDGSCCAIIEGQFYKRYDCKHGKTPPAEAIPCCPPDPVTGHWPHWAPVKSSNPGDKWFVKALENKPFSDNRTYEAVGPHFNGNPYGLEKDMLIPHGQTVLDDAPHSFLLLKEYLAAHKIEGIVFWVDETPVCKIKRSDFGLEWPVKGASLAESLPYAELITGEVKKGKTEDNKNAE